MMGQWVSGGWKRGRFSKGKGEGGMLKKEKRRQLGWETPACLEAGLAGRRACLAGGACLPPVSGLRLQAPHPLISSIHNHPLLHPQIHISLPSFSPPYFSERDWDRQGQAGSEGQSETSNSFSFRQPAGLTWQAWLTFPCWFCSFLVCEWILCGVCILFGSGSFSGFAIFLNFQTFIHAIWVYAPFIYLPGLWRGGSTFIYFPFFYS